MNNSWRQHPIKEQLYGHRPTITKIIRLSGTRYVGHCWRNQDILLWTPSHRRSKAGDPARTYIQQLRPIQDIALKTSWEQWTIETGGEKGSGRSVLAVRHDDGDIYCIVHKWIHVYILLFIKTSFLWTSICILSWSILRYKDSYY